VRNTAATDRRRWRSRSFAHGARSRSRACRRRARDHAALAFYDRRKTRPTLLRRRWFGPRRRRRTFGAVDGSARRFAPASRIGRALLLWPSRFARRHGLRHARHLLTRPALAIFQFTVSPDFRGYPWESNNVLRSSFRAAPAGSCGSWSALGHCGRHHFGALGHPHAPATTCAA